MDWPLVLTGLAGSTAAGVATGVGALPVFFIRSLSPRLEGAFLGFAAGVMLTAAFRSLLSPALELAGAHVAGPLVGHAEVVAGLALGAIAVQLANRFAPHEHFVIGVEGVPTESLQRIWLIVIAIALHNVPEGLAVGVSFGGPDVANGTSAALGIGLQNLPEGLAVAAALASINYPRWIAFSVALATGLLEPVSGFVGIALVSWIDGLLPCALAFAAGAMVWVVSAEIIPETHTKGHQATATGALMAGLILMVVIDAVLAGG
ncbi:MAG: ZIP family metal transporter [Phenylobacterium sp.]|uniref:ZIP family metal transporter n=1 Tax=Phenylobacterium sp. TaxID=1871053 RepID=UPI001A306884|nr:ZIP family metal transporter [Phenylobacterium sp.]MBJ7409388.1 ZIP family metal transporter [Phenylobacterium sp.]